MKLAGAIEVFIYFGDEENRATGYAMTDQQLEAFARKCFEAGVNSLGFKGLDLYDIVKMLFRFQPREQVVFIEKQQTFSDFWQAAKEEGNGK